MTIPTLINSAWFIVFLFTLIAVLVAGYSGWKKYKGEVFWRSIKLYASMFAVVGICVALMNFDIATRSLWKDDVEKELLLEYIDVRTELAMSMAKICSETAALPNEQNSCWDLKNIGGQIASRNLRNRTPLEPLKNWQNNPRIEETIKIANMRIDWLNRNMAIPVNDRQIIPPSVRMWILLIAAFLFSLAAAGTIGEAAYQLRRAKDRPDS